MPARREWTRHVGDRVVVRVRAPEGRTRDVLGELLEADEARLLIASRTGVQEIPLADVLSGKPVPPPPVRAARPHRALGASGLETVMARHWQAPDTAPLGGWLLRAAEGFTNRANSVLPLAEPDRPPAEAVTAAAAWYRARGLPPRAALPHDLGDPVLAAAADAFAAAGWAPIGGAGAHVLTAPTAALRDPGAAPPEGLTTRLAPEPDEGWLARYHYRGQELPPIGRALLLSAPEQAFVSVLDGGRTVAVARGSLAGGWGGLTAVEVDAGYRRRGLARLLLAAVAEWAWWGGAVSTYVQVGETNEAGLALYQGAGFERHHSYAYLEAS